MFPQAKDPVVGLHPDFCFSYAPGVVLDTGHEIKVRFYDGSEAHLPRYIIMIFTLKFSFPLL